MFFVLAFGNNAFLEDVPTGTHCVGSDLLGPRAWHGDNRRLWRRGWDD